MLNVEELFELEENIKEELDDHLTAALSRMNRSEQLEDFLRLLGMEHLLHKESGYEVYKTGKIVVIGQSDVKPEVLLSIAKQLGLDKNVLNCIWNMKMLRNSTSRRCNGSRHTVC